MEIKSKRLSNFEILRVLCMFMVVVMHCTWHGASPLFNKADIPQPYYNLIGINLIYPVINIAVDVFVLISGYFMSVQFTDAGCWRKVFSKSLRLWLQIAFYSVFFYVGYTLLRGTTFSVKDLVHYVLPVRFDQYWFMTSYMMLLVISPFLTKIVSVLSIGIEGIDSNLGTAIRTTVVLLMAWLMVFVTGKQKEIKAAAGVLLITAGTILLAII